ncbi:MAG: hypothetical protein B7Z55_09065, partial [Planctomycetales bacterium 12-60-4]
MGARLMGGTDHPPDDDDTSKQTVPPESSDASPLNARTIPYDHPTIGGLESVDELPTAPGSTVDSSIPQSIGPYTIVRRLGSGAMGAVYLAEDPQLGRRVAIKVPKFDPHDSAETIHRFLREARAAAALSHANICEVHDIGEHEGIPFIVMQYVDGRPLSDFIRAEKPLTERQIANLVRKIALALSEPHSRGIIHRDLKPGNIMIDRRGEPIIMDFGLARMLHRSPEDSATQSGMMLGTPAYMPPEQASGDHARLGPHSDLYSLGIMLYELLTGQRPFRGSLMQILSAIANARPPHPSEIRPAISPELDRICWRLIQKVPDDRYQSATDLVRDLVVFLKSRPPDSGSSAITVAPSRQEADTAVEASLLASVRGADLPTTRQVSRRPQKLRPVAMWLVAGGVVAAIAAPAVWIAWPASEPVANTPNPTLPPPVLEGGESVVEAASTPAATDTAPTSMLAIDREVAAWVLSRPGSLIEIEDPQGARLSLTNGQLPDDPF